MWKFSDARSVAMTLCVYTSVALSPGFAEPAGTLQGVEENSQNTPPPSLDIVESTPAAEPDASTPFSLALSDALTKIDSDREELIQFYSSRNNMPFWTGASDRSLQSLKTALLTISDHGLPASRYRAHLAALEMKPDTPEGQVRQELAAMEAYFAVASDLSAGILRPRAIDEEINVRPRRPDAEAMLDALAGSSVAVALGKAEPQDADYRALIAEKARLEALLGTAPWGEPVAAGPSLHEGESSPRIAQLRARLTGKGFLPEADLLPEEEAAYDAPLTEAVKGFQAANGLVDDGIAGRRTLEAVNASVEDKLKQVLVNLERLRWMNGQLTGRHIVANIPDFTVAMYDQGKTVWSSKTVVGKSVETRTPEFSDEMTYFVVNPTWHIPDSIATRIYLPKLRKDPTVLERSNMRLFTRSGREINPKLVNFKQYTDENFPFRVKQNPSRANALGQVKFMFPNQFAIYLHDTPAKSYFAKDARAFSNGCVRLERPVALAHELLKGQIGNPSASFEAWVAAESEKHVYLKKPVRVHLIYRTVWQGEDGKIQYRSDIYGRDRKVFDALEAKGVTIASSGQGQGA